MKQDLNIRKATEDDVIEIYNLVCELAAYEKARDQVKINEEQYLEDFRKGLYEAFVLVLDDQVIGTTIYYYTYSTWRGKMIYLEDFIISEPYRNKGYGKELFLHFIEYCRSEDANIVRWQVLDWNEPAIRFYKKFPVQFDPEWLTVKWIL